jgi:hypothetical protein
MTNSELPPETSELPEETENEELLHSDENLEEYFARMGEHMPPIEIELFSGPHASAYDARDINEKIDACDIYIPESVGWTDDVLNEVNQVARGEEIPKVASLARLRGEPIPNFLAAQMDHLYQSNKPVVLIDYPKEIAGQMLEKKYAQEFNKKELWEETFDQAVEHENEIERSRAEGVREREAYMYAHLAPKILEVIHEHPELRGKSKLKILLTLGAAHTNIYHQLKESGTNIDRDLSDMPFVYDHATELSRRHFFEKEITEDQKEKALLARLLLESVKPLSFDTHKIIKLLRVLIDILDPSDHREIFAEWSAIQGRYQQTLNAKRVELFKEHEKEEAVSLYREWQKRHRLLCDEQFREVLEKKFTEKDLFFPGDEEAVDRLLNESDNGQPE